MKQDTGETHEAINKSGKTQEVKVMKHKEKTFQNKTGTKVIRQQVTQHTGRLGADKLGKTLGAGQG